MNKTSKFTKISALFVLTLSSSSVMASCPNITYAQLNSALQASVKPTNGGLDFNMWATIVGTARFVR